MANLKTPTPKPKKAKAKAKAKKRAAPKPKPAPEDVPLTAKQKAFCDWYVSAEVKLNGTDAARRAGYRGNDKTLAAIASQNLAKLNVRRYVDELLQKAMAGAEVTVEATLKHLADLREEARSAGQYGPAVKATELQGKYLKMFTDRIEHVETLDSVESDELENLLAELLSDESGQLANLVRKLKS